MAGAEACQRGVKLIRQTYKYLGYCLTLKGWSVRLGLDYDVLRLRLKKGWSVKRAFETPVDKTERAPAKESRVKRCAASKQKPKILEYKGERRTVSEWAKHLDMPRITIDKRLRQGYSVGQCLGLEPIKFDYSWRCRKLTYKGETLTTREWADRLHVSLCQFCVRIRKGLPEDELFAENYRVRKRKEIAARKREKLKARKLRERECAKRKGHPSK